ncbi:Putative cell survival pathways protein [Pseudogymnoascus destructans]|uniref:Cell survival pathways protein n=2 Tax=Pseudogymnoascus destructans TaxID=655981 RepID=L8G974_PSED2|nr:Putative cell survival pathways protein [Pseudogymnoascus destructans]ELR09602.1 hypothetical protein GMDG_04096 [Pseudogymnoascus destructans 20631-21]OAF57831.2 Putative cell survival pathways protein [Pseudogymnoascus destructans]
MMNWAKQALANVAGTQEPIYGPSAIRSVSEQAATVPYTELTREDLKWVNMDSTSVETQVFYLTADSGHIAFVQVIHSNVAGIRRTSQFNTKIFYPDGAKPILWASDPLSDVDFSDDGVNYYAENLAVELSEDGKTYTIKSMTNKTAIVNITMTQTAPGFQAGKDGTTLFGTDLENPWGKMRHVFWPRNKVEGTIVTGDGPIDFKGKGMFVYALQGMKPHHAAGKWNFVDFHGDKFTAVMMEYTTPASYGSTIVNVGAIVKDGEVIMASSPNKATHVTTKSDSDNDWPEPATVKYEWSGKTKDGKTVEAVLETALGGRLDRIDVMAEVPGFVKTIVANTAGTKPYIYQYSPTAAPSLKLKIGEEEEVVETGKLFAEATFITA